MASAMGGPLLPPSSATGQDPLDASSTGKHASTANHGGSTIRIYYSLKENPNAIISYADLVREEQKKRREASSQERAKGSLSASPNPLKNSKVTSTGSTTGSGATKDSSAMDVDPADTEDTRGDSEVEAEVEDEDSNSSDDNEGGEAEEEDSDEEEDDDEGDEDEDDESRGRKEPRDFLEALAEKYAKLDENGNEGEDEDEDEDDESKASWQSNPVLPYKRKSRWDTEQYDVEDEFIDDSEMMLESIGMVRPKVGGFFAYRGPVETTTNEDPDSSDAVSGSRSRRTGKRKLAAGSSPLSSSRGTLSKTVKNSSLSVMENANDSTSEMSEMDDKIPKSKKTASAVSPSTPSGLAISSAANDPNGATSGTGTGTEAGTPSATSRKKTGKAKSTGKDIVREETDVGKDSDKDAKATPKKSRAKSTKAGNVTAATTPIVRVDSPTPAPEDEVSSESVNKQSSRASSPEPTNSILDSSTATAEGGSAKTTTEIPSSATAEPAHSQRPKVEIAADSSSGTGKAKAKSLFPLSPEVQKAFDAVAALAGKETWEVKTRFPPHIRQPLFDCAKVALSTRASGYVVPESFFLHLQTIFPYNKFTLKKLIYKNILPPWINELEVQKAGLIDQFGARTNMVWKSSGLADLEKDKPEDRDVDGDVNMTGDEGKPLRKFPWSQDLRLLLWETMEKFMEILAAKQQLHFVDESYPAPLSESKTRKDAYQMLLLSFPAGWMTSYEISRQYSQLKEKVQKQERKEVEATNAAGQKAGGSKTSASVSLGRSDGAKPTNSPMVEKKSSFVSSVSVPIASPTNNVAAAAAAAKPATLITSPVAYASSHTAATKASPTVSSPKTHRTAHLSEILHHPTPQSSRIHHPYSGNAVPTSNDRLTAMADPHNTANTKKRKKDEDHHVPTTGNLETIVISDSESYSSEYYQSSVSGAPNGKPGNGTAGYPSLQSDAAKKKKMVDSKLPKPMSTPKRPSPSGPSPTGPPPPPPHSSPPYHHRVPPASYPKSHDVSGYHNVRGPMYPQRRGSPTPAHYSAAPSSHANHSHGLDYPHSSHPPKHSPPQQQHYQRRSETMQRRISPPDGGSGYMNPSGHSPSRSPSSSHTSAMSMSNLVHPNPVPSKQPHSRSHPGQM
ncbi:hypothetical protein BGW38_010614 [Lunasporangiospora selenospora]|uniref:Ubinuclein middle domain-containing protein n=1 Tax=Lunasporangiospora selenospora TaxID=979761 RepID=A0A9P6KET0_9FUNG|nr:hypothetical protein BGW38_010614 [Lunasporangiospora selenospora]